MSRSTKKDDLRLPPMEAIITRHKSAQLKRQLRNKDQSMIRITQYTQLLRSPTGKRAPNNKNSQKSPVIKPKSPKKDNKLQDNPKKSQIKSNPKKSITREEFYPNKLKRHVETKKVVLKPRHEMKLIGDAARISKRKLGMPQKGPYKHAKIDHCPKLLQKRNSSKTDYTELSMVDIIRMTEESHSLDDDDLMEILTCPSPVWWEDPPSDMYIEDALFSISPSPIESQRHSPVLKTEEPIFNCHIKNENKEQSLHEVIYGSKEITLRTKLSDDRFMNKRSKLENLLGSIKNKSTTEISQNNASVGCKIGRKVMKPSKTTMNKINGRSNLSQANIKHVDNKRKSKIHSEIVDDDFLSSLRDEILLNNLENLAIPIESKKKVGLDINPLSKNLSDSKGESTSKTYKKEKNQNTNSSKTISKVDLTVIEESSITSEVKDDVTTQIPSKLPPLHRIPVTSTEKVIITSPMSLRSIVSDDTYDSSSLVSNQDNLDSISDTNIRFVDDEDTSSSKASEVTRNSEKINNDIPKTSDKSICVDPLNSDEPSNEISKNSDISNTEIHKTSDKSSSVVPLNSDEHNNEISKNADKCNLEITNASHKSNNIIVPKNCDKSNNEVPNTFDKSIIEVPKNYDKSSNEICKKSDESNNEIPKTSDESNNEVPKTSVRSDNIVPKNFDKSNNKNADKTKDEIPGNLGKSDNEIARPVKPNDEVPSSSKSDRKDEAKYPVNKNKLNTESCERISNIKTNREKTDCMTVYRIITSDIPIERVTKINNINTYYNSIVTESTKSSGVTAAPNKEVTINKSSGNIEVTKSRLDSFFKKFKHSYHKGLKNLNELKNNNTSEVHIAVNENTNKIENTHSNHVGNVNIEKKTNEAAQTVCEQSEPVSNKSIILNDSDSVRYCMKCSCIFETEECAYCVKKAQSPTSGGLACQNCNTDTPPKAS